MISVNDFSWRFLLKFSIQLIVCHLVFFSCFTHPLVWICFLYGANDLIFSHEALDPLAIEIDVIFMGKVILMPREHLT